MPGKLLLIADDERFRELRAQGDLPQSWLVGTTAESLLQAIEQQAPRIVGVRPSVLLPPEGGSKSAQEREESLDDQGRSEFINYLLSETLCCYLAVAEGSPGGTGAEAAAGGDRDSADARRDSPSREPRSSWRLAEHLAWYERFRSEVKQRAKARHVHLRHVLILVCCQDPPSDQLADLQKLVGGDQREGPFDVCYVMLEELEPGRKPGTFFNAAHVWPISVSSLLLKLLHDDATAGTRSAAAYAWRCYQLAPDIEPRDQERLCSQHFDELFRLLTGSSSVNPNWNREAFTKFEIRAAVPDEADLKEPADDRAAANVTWLDYAASQRLDQVTAARRWEQSLMRAGDELGRRLSRTAIEEEPAAWSEVEKVWSLAHREPHFIYVALADHDLIAGPALSDQFQVTASHWQQILEKDRQREQLIKDTGKCAKHFNAAQNGFVNLLFRLLVIGVVTLFVGYVAMLVYHSLLGRTLVGVLVAFAGGLGAVLAVLFSFDRERRAGRNAQDAFEELLDEMDRKVKERHECCQNAVQAASVFAQQLSARAAARRLERLLHRVQRILDYELRFRPDPEEALGPEEAVRDAGTDAPAARDRRLRQRSRFRRETLLRHQVHLQDLHDKPAEDPLAEFVQDEADAFRHELWSRFCEQHDKGRSGNLPARELIPLVRDFRERFQAKLVARIRSLAIKQLGPGELDGWSEALRDIVAYQDYFELMSCRLLAHQTARATDRPRPRLYLREGFDSANMMNYLGGTQVVENPQPSPYLEHMPIVGFLFQETPVQFEPGADGKITLAPFDMQPSSEGQDRGQQEEPAEESGKRTSKGKRAAQSERATKGKTSTAE